MDTIYFVHPNLERIPLPMKNRLVMLFALCLGTLVACSSSTAPSGGSEQSSGGSSSGGSSSGSTTTPPPGEDGGPGVVQPGQDAAAPQTLATCIAACSAKYPAASVQNKQLDATCFLGGACEPVCNDLKAGKNFLPDAPVGDAGVVCDTVKANSFPISTPSLECSNCLANNAGCCALWIQIFSSSQGQGLNDCSNTCYSSF